MQLRDYQQRAIDELRIAYRKHRAPCLVLPTGGGKTVIASAIVRGALERGNRVLFLAHRTELLDQTIRKLEANGITDTRLIKAGIELGNPSARATVASIQTITARKRYPDADLVVFDECHHVKAATWQQLAEHYRSSRLLGMTATPQRGDGKALGDIFDSMVIGATMNELVAQGHLVPCIVKAPPDALDKKRIAMSAAAAYERFSPNERAVVFCGTLKHARELAAEFKVPTGIVHGKLPAAERARILLDPNIRVLVNVHVLTEGWDDPSCSVCIMARAPGHDGTFLQMVGRVLRPSPGKTRALLLDLCGSVFEHGTPDAERVYSLDGDGVSHTREPIKQCPTCGSVFRASEARNGCPVCGAIAARHEQEVPRVVGVDIADVGTVAPRATPTIAMTSKFPGTCATCQKPYRAGEKILWARPAIGKAIVRHYGCLNRVAEANRIMQEALNARG